MRTWIVVLACCLAALIRTPATWAQDFVWARQLGGGAAGVSAAGVTLDAAGNVYTVGQFGGTADFDPGPATVNLTSGGGGDAFISKLDSGGGFVWAKQLGGGAGSVSAYGVSLDAAGNVYTVGQFQGTADFDPGIPIFNLTSGPVSAFISKLDGGGGFVWAKQLGGGAGGVIAYGVSLDAAGDVYTAGLFQGTADFDPGLPIFNLISSGSSTFISKLNSGGGFVWAKQLGEASTVNAAGVTLDAAGNVYTVGFFGGTADFDPGIPIFYLTSGGGSNAFISKLNIDGIFVWAKQLGVTGGVRAAGVTLDAAADNVYTVGHFGGTADFDPGPATVNLTSAGNDDAFISKLNIDGIFVWAKQLGGGAAGVIAYGVSLDAAGNVYTVGRFSGTADFDPGPPIFNLTSAGSVDAFISMFNIDGGFVWARQLGGAGTVLANGVSLDAAGNVYTVGQFGGTADFDPGPATVNLTSAGHDAFICKLTGGCVDQDGDGYGSPGFPSCRAGAASDCDDTNAAINPGAVEACDGLDNDCDLTIDGFATFCGVGQCASTGTCTAGVDNCTPGQPSPEICDGLDNDCDGSIDNNVPVPVGAPFLSAAPSGSDVLLTWTPLAGATGYDVVRGSLATLRSTGGNFTAAVNACVGDNVLGTSVVAMGSPGTGDGSFFLVRGVNCGGAGTYDSGTPSQVGLRDAEIDAAAMACP